MNTPAEFIGPDQRARAFPLSARHSHLSRCARLLLGLWLFATSASFAAAERQPRGFVANERVILGGIPQSIVIRGRDRTLPVLLFVHGGPGFSQRPFAHANAELERDFVVVHWDQRGTGRSFSPDIPRESMRIERFVSDVEELSRYLSRKFGQEKIYLLGHSWGSMIGLLAAARSPELYHAYIGVAQVIDIPESERVLHVAALRAAREKGDAKALGELQRIGPPPYKTLKGERRINAISKMLSPQTPNGMSSARWIGLALTSPDFSVFETPRLMRGIRFTGFAMRDEIYATDLADRVRTIRVPAYFLIGRFDTVISPAPTVRFFQKLRAPAGKRLIWFERSDHWPHLEEREKYADVLRGIKAASERPR